MPQILMFLIAAVLFLTAAAPASADPVTALATILGPALGAAAPFVAQIVVGLVSAAASYLITKHMTDSAATSVKFEVEFGDTLPLNFIAGRYATAGRRKYIGSWGKNSRYVTDVIEVSALPQGFSALWVDGELAEIGATTDGDGTGYNLGYPITSLDNDDGQHRAWIKWHDGTQGLADSFLVAEFGSDPDYPWTANAVGRGKAYAVLTYRYDEDTQTSMPSVLIEPEPLPVYDPRKDDTAGGSGTHRWGTRATYEPSTNLMVIAYNIARGIYYADEWVYGGKNLEAWRLPLDEWVAAMNAADMAFETEAGDFIAAGHGGLNIEVDKSPSDILDEIAKSANARYSQVGGKLKVLVDLPGAAVLSMTDGDVVITEGQSLSPFYPASQTFNALQATYPEPAEKWATKDAPELVLQDYVDADGQYLPTSASYPALTDSARVQKVMRAQLQDYRRMVQHQFYLPPMAFGLEPLDMIAWTSDHNGYSSKLFVVEAVSKTFGMLVAVQLREVDPTDVDWDKAYQKPVNIITPVNPIRPLQTISGLSIQGVAIQDSNGLNRRPAIQISCDSDEAGVRTIQVQVRLTGTTDRTSWTFPFIEPFVWYVQDVLNNESYDVRVRLRSAISRSNVWTNWVTVTTPNVGLGIVDFDADVSGYLTTMESWITAGVIDLPGTLGELGSVTRYTRDQLRAMGAETLDGLFYAESQRGDMQASITELRYTTATELYAQSVVIQDLQASIGSVTALAEAYTSLEARVEVNEGEIVALADSLTALSADVGQYSADGLFRVSVLATPSGALSRIGLYAAATDTEGEIRSAALYLEAVTGDKSRVVIDADYFAVTKSGTGERMVWEGGAIKVYDASNVLRVELGNLA